MKSGFLFGLLALGVVACQNGENSQPPAGDGNIANDGGPGPATGEDNTTGGNETTNNNDTPAEVPQANDDTPGDVTPNGDNYFTGNEIFVDAQDYTVSVYDNINTFRGGTVPAEMPWTSLKVRNGTDMTYPPGDNAAIGDERGSGWIYTVDAIPGDEDRPIPGVIAQRALCIENYSTTLQRQSEIRITFTREPETVNGKTVDPIPADVWFQFWIYFPDDPDWLSSFNNPKFIYPNKESSLGGSASYANGTLDWLSHLGVGSKVPSFVSPMDITGPRYFKPFSEDGGSGDLYDEGDVFLSEGALHYPWTEVGHRQTGDRNWNHKLGHVDPDTGIEPGKWFLVRLHYDTSYEAKWACDLLPEGEACLPCDQSLEGQHCDPGTQLAEGEIREYGDPTWRLMYRWQNGQDYLPVIDDYGRGGVFRWNLKGLRSQTDPSEDIVIFGHRSISWPTTMAPTNGEGGDSRFYISDFAMAAGIHSGGNGADDLPVYNSY